MSGCLEMTGHPFYFVEVNKLRLVSGIEYGGGIVRLELGTTHGFELHDDISFTWNNDRYTGEIIEIGFGYFRIRNIEKNGMPLRGVCMKIQNDEVTDVR